MLLGPGPLTFKMAAMLFEGPIELYTRFMCIKQFVNDFYRGLIVCFKVPCNRMNTDQAKQLKM